MVQRHRNFSPPPASRVLVLETTQTLAFFGTLLEKLAQLDIMLLCYNEYDCAHRCWHELAFFRQVIQVRGTVWFCILDEQSVADAVKHDITIVQATRDKRLDQGIDGFRRQRSCNRAQLSKLKVAYRRGV